MYNLVRYEIVILELEQNYKDRFKINSDKNPSISCRNSHRAIILIISTNELKYYDLIVVTILF